MRRAVSYYSNAVTVGRFIEDLLELRNLESDDAVITDFEMEWEVDGMGRRRNSIQITVEQDADWAQRTG